jgi:hypothetical protein
MYALLTIATIAAATNDGNANTRPEWKVKFYDPGSACNPTSGYLGCAASSAAGVSGCDGRVGNCTPALAVLGGVARPDPDEVPTRTLTVESCSCTSATLSIHDESGTEKGDGSMVYECDHGTILDRRTVSILGEEGSACVPDLDIVVMCPQAYWDGGCAATDKSKSDGTSWPLVLGIVALCLVGLAVAGVGLALAHRCFVRHAPPPPKLPSIRRPVSVETDDDTIYLDDVAVS